MLWFHVVTREGFNIMNNAGTKLFPRSVDTDKIPPITQNQVARLCPLVNRHVIS